MYLLRIRNIDCSRSQSGTLCLKGGQFWVY